MRRTAFHIEISQEFVLNCVGVSKDSDLYEEVLEELQEMLPAAMEKIAPSALLEFGKLDSYEIEREGKKISDVLFSVISIGKEMEMWSSCFFQRETI